MAERKQKPAKASADASDALGNELGDRLQKLSNDVYKAESMAALIERAVSASDDWATNYAAEMICRRLEDIASALDDIGTTLRHSKVTRNPRPSVPS